MIELNAELLRCVLGYVLNTPLQPSTCRVFMEFQARGIPLTDARAQQYVHTAWEVAVAHG